MVSETQLCRSLQTNMNNAFGTYIRAESQRILLLHGTCMCYISYTLDTSDLVIKYQLCDHLVFRLFVTANDVVPSEFVYKCVDSLRTNLFPTMFKQCGGYKHRLLLSLFLFHIF